eukprot:GABV01007715.1.p2 GENE.GABV01007715.1~~GABV01007715.1.p2  ORF type:complete len:105 (-),score=22.97 GABV01007715.1:3-317(-)
MQLQQNKSQNSKNRHKSVPDRLFWDCDALSRKFDLCWRLLVLFKQFGLNGRQTHQKKSCSSSFFASKSTEKRLLSLSFRLQQMVEQVAQLPGVARVLFDLTLDA